MVEPVQNGSSQEVYYTDHNGEVKPRRSLNENKYTEEQLRSIKQKFLMENVINSGYDPTEFAQFMEYKMEGGTNVDNWEFEALMSVVFEFHQYYQPGGGARTLNTEESEGPSSARGELNDGDQPDPQDKKSASGADSEFEDITDNGLHIDATLPKLETRTRAPTAAIVPTAINRRKVTLKVVDSEVRKGGFFSSDYVLYTITTEPNGWRVGRKDTDFYTLRRILKAQFPHVLIPPLPLKSNKMTQKFLTKREKQFTRFLQAISRSEELKSSICLNNFLEIEDLKEFQKANKIFEKTKYGKSIVELVTEKGQVGVNMNQNAMVFCTRMTDFTDSYQILYSEIIETTREIKEKSADLAKTMHTLGEHLEKLGNVNYMIRVDRMHELYAWLSKMSTGTGNHLANLGDLFHVYLGSHLKYHMSEHESFRELSTLREQVKQNFIKKERHLIERKEKLFKSQDISRWGFEGAQDDLIRRKEELFLDKEKAFRFMLTKESQELEHFREELFFYSNQCLSEVRRVGQDNGLLLTDHFITMSQIECAYINQHHVMWADFLSHFSEIGLINDGVPDISQHEVIKQQRPVDSAAGVPPKEEEKKKADAPTAAAAVNGIHTAEQKGAEPEAKEASAAASTSNFLSNVRDLGEDESPAFSRRISRLDNDGKFAASLDAVKVDKSAQGADKQTHRVASLVAAQAAVDPNLVKEEDEGSDSDYGVESVQLTNSNANSQVVPPTGNNTNTNTLTSNSPPAGQQEPSGQQESSSQAAAVTTAAANEERKEAPSAAQSNQEQPANAEETKSDRSGDDDDSHSSYGVEMADNTQSRVAESGGDTSQLRLQDAAREESAGGEQSSRAPAVSDSQEAN